MVKKIVLTGGPCSGKTTVLKSIKEYYEKSGFRVVVVPETATELINDGIKCFGKDRIIDCLNYQELVMKMQISKEMVVDRLLEMNPYDDVLVLYDRGLLDGQAYVSEDEFSLVMKKIDRNLMREDLLKRYDAVVVLIGDKSFYTLDTNSARSEGVDEALNLGKKTMKSWIAHNDIKLVFPKDTMEEKTNEVIDYIDSVVHEENVHYKYAIDLSRSNIDGLNCIDRIDNVSCYVESKLYFVVDQHVCCIEVYRDTDRALLYVDAEIGNIPSLKDFYVLDEYKPKSLVMECAR